MPNPLAASRAAWLLALCALASGCATITTHSSTGKEIVMTREEFEQYVEHVFRYHNQVMSDLIENAIDRPEQSPHDLQVLNLAEKKMVTACQPLNEVVSESLSGENVGLTLKMELIDTVPACEAASKAVDDLMP